MKRYLLTLAVSVMLMSCFFGRTLVLAGEGANAPVYHRYYTSVEIAPGDSLWSIAETYNKHSGMDNREYVRELKALNRISADRINAGDCLMVIYFAE